MYKILCTRGVTLFGVKLQISLVIPLPRCWGRRSQQKMLMVVVPKGGQ